MFAAASPRAGWVADAGAANHVTCDALLLLDARPVTIQHACHQRRRQHLQASLVGSVILKSTTPLALRSCKCAVRMPDIIRQQFIT